MKRTVSLILFSILTLLILVPLAFAKGSPDKIIIWGPSLAEPIEITNLEVLNRFDPWNGRFLNRSSSKIVEEPRAQEIYTVAFDLGTHNHEGHVFYIFQYAPDPSGQQGFIYLPGEGEPWHLANGQTIIRTSGWHSASAEWDALMRSTLEQDRVSPVEPIISRDLQLAVTMIILLGGTVTLWYLRRRQPVSI